MPHAKKIFSRSTLSTNAVSSPALAYTENETLHPGIKATPTVNNLFPTVSVKKILTSLFYQFRQFVVYFKRK
jgi:hypothetical protein